MKLTENGRKRHNFFFKKVRCHYSRLNRTYEFDCTHASLMFTQKTISHKLTGLNNMTEIYNKVKGLRETGRLNHGFTKDDLIRNGLSANLFTLEAIPVKESGTTVLYCCNNRRLCLLKNLKKNLGFNGMININTRAQCGHQIEIGSNDPWINYGNKPGRNCSELTKDVNPFRR